MPLFAKTTVKDLPKARRTAAPEILWLDTAPKKILLMITAISKRQDFYRGELSATASLRLAA